MTDRRQESAPGKAPRPATVRNLKPHPAGYWTPERRANAGRNIHPAVMGQPQGAPRSGLGLSPAYTCPINDPNTAALPYSAMGQVYYTQSGTDYVAMATLCFDSQTLITAGHVMAYNGVLSTSATFNLLSAPTTDYPIGQFIVADEFQEISVPAFDMALCTCPGLGRLKLTGLTFAQSLLPYMQPSGITSYGYPQTPVGIFAFDGSQLWSVITQVLLFSASASEPVLISSIMSSGADGGPWIGQDADKEPVIVGINGTYVGGMWSSPSFLGWISVLYGRLTGGTTGPYHQDVSGMFGANQLSMVFYNGLLYVAGAGNWTTYVPDGDFSLKGSKNYYSLIPTSLWVNTINSYCNVFVNGKSVYITTSNFVGRLSPGQPQNWVTSNLAKCSPWYSTAFCSQWIPNATNPGSANFMLTAQPGESGGPGTIIGINVSDSTTSEPFFTIPMFATKGDFSVAVASAGVVQYGTPASIMQILVGSNGQVMMYYVNFLLVNKELTVNSGNVWPQIVPLNSSAPMSLLYNKGLCWAANEGTVYTISRGSGGHMASMQWPLNSQMMNVTLAADDDYVYAATGDGCFGVFTPDGSKVVVFQGANVSPNIMAVIQPLAGGDVAVAIGGVVYLAVWNNTDPQINNGNPYFEILDNYLEVTCDTITDLAINPADPTTLYVAGLGTLTMIPLSEPAAPLLSLTQSKPKPPIPAMAERRAQMRKNRQGAKRTLHEGHESFDAYNAAVQAYWTPERRSKVRRNAGVVGSPTPVPNPAGSFPTSSIGLVYAVLDGRDVCATGTVVGPSAVMTVAHMLYDYSYATNIAFQLPGQSSPVTASIAFVPSQWMEGHNTAYDMAIFVMPNRFSNTSQVFYLPSSPADQPITVYAYPAGEAGGMVQASGDIDGTYGQFPMLNISLSSGSDGAPWLNASNQIVGLTSRFVDGSLLSPPFSYWVSDFVNGCLTEGPTVTLPCPTAGGVPVVACAFAGFVYYGSIMQLNFINYSATGHFKNPVSIPLGDGAQPRLSACPPASLQESNGSGALYVATFGTLYGITGGQSSPFATLVLTDSANQPILFSLPMDVLYLPIANEVAAAAGGYLYLADTTLTEAQGWQWTTDAKTVNAFPRIASDGVNVFVAANGVVTACAIGAWGTPLFTATVTTNSCGNTHLVVANGIVYVGDAGTIWQIEIATGTVTSLPNIVFGTPEVKLDTDGEYVFAAAGGSVCSFNPGNPGSFNFSTLMPTTTPMAVLFNEGSLFVCGGGTLLELDPATLTVFGAGDDNFGNWPLPGAGNNIDFELAMDPFDPSAVYVGWPGNIARVLSVDTAPPETSTFTN